jgi:hypothetical protein
MITMTKSVLALSLLFAPLALAQEPPASADRGRDGLSQVVWRETPRGEVAAADSRGVAPLPAPPVPAPPTAEALALSAAAEAEAELAKFVLDHAGRRALALEGTLEEARTLLYGRRAPLVDELGAQVKELKRQLRRAGSTCPEAYSGFVRQLLPKLDAAERSAARVATTLGQTSEARRTLGTLSGLGQRLELESRLLPPAERDLVEETLEVARENLEAARQALDVLDVTTARDAAARVHRAFDGAFNLLRNARRGSGPSIR